MLLLSVIATLFVGPETSASCGCSTLMTANDTCAGVKESFLFAVSDHDHIHLCSAEHAQIIDLGNVSSSNNFTMTIDDNVQRATLKGSQLSSPNCEELTIDLPRVIFEDDPLICNDVNILDITNPLNVNASHVTATTFSIVELLAEATTDIPNMTIIGITSAAVQENEVRLGFDWQSISKTVPPHMGSTHLELEFEPDANALYITQYSERAHTFRFRGDAVMAVFSDAMTNQYHVSVMEPGAVLSVRASDGGTTPENTCELSLLYVGNGTISVSSGFSLIFQGNYTSSDLRIMPTSDMVQVSPDSVVLIGDYEASFTSRNAVIGRLIVAEGLTATATGVKQFETAELENGALLKAVTTDDDASIGFRTVIVHNFTDEPVIELASPTAFGIRSIGAVRFQEFEINWDARHVYSVFNLSFDSLDGAVGRLESLADNANDEDDRVVPYSFKFDYRVSDPENGTTALIVLQRRHTDGGSIAMIVITGILIVAGTITVLSLALCCD